MNDRSAGYCGCGCGEVYRLGERDCDGHIIGYVDDEGLCWESRHERNEAVGAGQLREHFVFGKPYPQWLHNLPRNEFDAVIAEYASQCRIFGWLRGRWEL